jgi:hypothetical protein
MVDYLLLDHLMKTSRCVKIDSRERCQSMLLELLIFVREENEKIVVA